MARSVAKDVEEKVRAYVRAVEAEIPVSAVYVFGSQAKGAATASSDIDVAVVSPSFGRDAFADGAYLQKKLWQSPYKNIDIVGYSPGDFADDSLPLVAEIKRNGVLIR